MDREIAAVSAPRIVERETAARFPREDVAGGLRSGRTEKLRDEQTCSPLSPRKGKPQRCLGVVPRGSEALERSGRVRWRVNPKDYKAILSAVEEAIAICDRYGDRMDEARRKVCNELRQVRAELRRQLNLPLSDSP